MDLLFNPISIAVISIIILVYSAILHEIAHGLVADRLGDPTARLMGRLTLNPKPHIDPILSLLLPLMLILSGSPVIFGGAKPVPVDPFNFRDKRKDIALVSLAGPGANILLAILGSLLLRGLLLFPENIGVQILGFFLLLVIKLNLLLAIFNLLPIPPLDGSKIFAMILPERESQMYLSLGNIGFFIIFFLLLFPIGGFSLGLFVENILTFSLNFLLP